MPISCRSAAMEGPTPGICSSSEALRRAFFLSGILDLEMRVLYQAKRIVEGIEQHRDLDTFAHVLDGVMRLGSQRNETRVFGFDVGGAPVCQRAAGTGRCIGKKPEFIAAYLEAGVKGLAEIRRVPHHFGVPLDGPGKIRGAIDDSA